jgi:hypothetical protein
MDDLRDRLQELADGYARTASSPGPAAAHRRGHSRRRRTAALVVLAGVVAVAVAAGLVPTLQATRPARPQPRPAPTLQPPGSTAWFRPTHVPSGYRRVVDKEWVVERLGPPLPGAKAFRKVQGNGVIGVSVNPDLQQLDVARELRTYPTVRAVRVRGHTGLLFPRRPGTFYTGVTWQERQGLVAQVIGSQGVPDRMLLSVAEGLRIVQTPAATIAITVATLPNGWVRDNNTAVVSYMSVLPRSHHQVFTKGRGERPQFVVIETRDQFGPATAVDLDGYVPGARRVPVTVHGHPATLLYAPRNTTDPAMHELAISWREPGGIELVVLADYQVSRRQILAIAQGLQQP